MKAMLLLLTVRVALASVMALFATPSSWKSLWRFSPPLIEKLTLSPLSNGRLNCGLPLKVTPVASVARLIGLRPTSGSSRMRSFSITCPREAVSASSSGESALTVTVSPTSPTSRLTSKVALSAVCSSTMSLCARLNPWASTVTV